MKRAVVLIITNTVGQVLLLKRGDEHNNFPGEWCLPGGKVDLKHSDPRGNAYGGVYEHDDEAAIRECIEETGYIPTLIKDTGLVATGKDKQFVVKVFKCLDDLPFFSTGDYEKIITREFPNREHTEYGFFDIHRLPKEIGSLTKTIITNS